MCFAQPKPQVDPTTPANYALNESYGQVTSSYTTPDGVTHGGQTIAQTYNDNIKMGKANKTPTVTTNAPADKADKQPRRTDYFRAGPTAIRM